MLRQVAQVEVLGRLYSLVEAEILMALWRRVQKLSTELTRKSAVEKQLMRTEARS